MTGVASKVPLSCGCVIFTPDDGDMTIEKCGTHRLQRLQEPTHARCATAESEHAAALLEIERLRAERDAAYEQIASGACYINSIHAILEQPQVHLLTDVAKRVIAERDAAVKERNALQDAMRMEWWANHGCAQAAIYGDDGERSCGQCFGDFKRMPFEELRTHVQGTRNKRLVAALDEAERAKRERGGGA